METLLAHQWYGSIIQPLLSELHLNIYVPLLLWKSQVYDLIIQGTPSAPSIVAKDAQRLGRHYLELG